MGGGRLTLPTPQRHAENPSSPLQNTTQLLHPGSPAKALEILSFFHSQGWSYSSGGRSSSSGSRDSLGRGQAGRSLSASSPPATGS